MQLPSRNIEVELTTVSSNYHVEMNPSDVGYQDRYVVQEIIKAGACPTVESLPDAEHETWGEGRELCACQVNSVATCQQ